MTQPIVIDETAIKYLVGAFVTFILYVFFGIASKGPGTYLAFRNLLRGRDPREIAAERLDNLHRLVETISNNNVVIVENQKRIMEIFSQMQKELTEAVKVQGHSIAQLDEIHEKIVRRK